MKMDAIITVRTSSSRLPEKCLLELYDGTVLEYVLNRARLFDFDPVIATTTDDSDDVIVDIAKRYDVRCFRGSVYDKLCRWKDACDVFSIERFVTIDCDDPFFDPTLTKLSYDMLSKFDVVSPDMNAYLGSHGWSFRRDAITLSCDTKKSNNTEMVWKHLDDSLSVADMHVHDVKSIEKHIRLTLDYIDDYVLIRTLSNILPYDCTRDDIVKLFEKHDVLCIVNEFRNDEWRHRQAQG